MSIDDDIALFEGVPTLALLGRDALRILAIGADTLAFEAGDALFHQGAESDAGYVVQRGSFELIDEHGRLRTIIATQGALIGDLALISPLPRPNTALARERSWVVRLPRTLFLKMLEGYPDAAVRLRSALADRVNELTADIVAVRKKIG